MDFPAALGSHRLWREDDVIGAQFAGELVRDDLEVLSELLRRIRGEHGRCYMLADAAGLTGISSEARKVLSERGHDDPDGQISGVGVHGISFAMRALSIMTLTTIKLLTRRPVVVHFASDEADARSWISQRRALDMNAAPPPSRD